MIQQTLESYTKFNEQQDQYVKITDESLVGIYVSLYVKRWVRPNIQDIAVSSLKLGMGKMGNKGACSIRFMYKDSALAFACCHLESGRSIELEQTRRKHISKIINNSFVKERGTNMSKYSWNSHQIKVIFGDLNFRSTEELSLENAIKLL